jgi:hypothetical protein
MSDRDPLSCPECNDLVDRRDFLRVAGSAATLAVGGAMAAAYLPSSVFAQPATPAAPAAAPPAAKAARPAEALCKELYAGLTADQRRQVLLPWNSPNRARFYNAPMNVRIGQVYTQPQKELLDRIMKSISSGDDGFAKLSRNGSWDTGGGFGGCGANFFGDPAAERAQWAFIFSGHHLTVRCDGDSEPDAAWGGPMYYGHVADGHSQRNVFHFQTRAVNTVFESLSEAQKRTAVITRGTPGEGTRSVEFRRDSYPGILSGDLTADQKQLVSNTMRDILAPYRREDVDEVMSIIRRNGGLDRLHFAFYRDANATDQTRWSFWRIEGPGFVWNYRVMPHVHCYVNIAARPQA